MALFTEVLSDLSLAEEMVVALGWLRPLFSSIVSIVVVEQRRIVVRGGSFR